MTIDLDAIEARARGQGNEPWDHMRIAADVPVLVAEVRGLEAALSAEYDAHLYTIGQRDAGEDAIERIAEHLGCESEWSNLHSHFACVDVAVLELLGEHKSLRAGRDDALARVRELETEVARYKSSATGWVEIVDDRATALRVLAGLYDALPRCSVQDCYSPRTSWGACYCDHHKSSLYSDSDIAPWIRKAAKVLGR